MIPNFALDNTVNRHILALASSGQAEWQTGGTRIKEWDLKKEYIHLLCIICHWYLISSILTGNGSEIPK